MKLRYPVYVPTKGRYETRFTIKALDALGIPYKAVVEVQELDKYVAAGVKPENILVLPHQNKGLVVTRNWIWDHALASGAKRFWTFDDNIRCFYRMNRSTKIIVSCPGMFCATEDFVDRYENIVIAGFHYEFFALRRDKLPPFYLNRRVYSNMLIMTDARDPRGKPYRNEGFYNDDTDLCLRVLKDGWCTILFLAFLAKKLPTMKVPGGMTPYYQKGLDGGEGLMADGRYRMALELKEKHPDVTKITRKFNRWQHVVDYEPFKRNRLRLRAGLEIPEGVDNYRMEVRRIH